VVVEVVDIGVLLAVLILRKEAYIFRSGICRSDNTSIERYKYA
jgi:hypothetical protein